MRTRLAAMLMLLSVLPGCTVWGKKPARAFAEATGGEQLERVFWQELKAKNYAELERRLASNFMGLAPPGRFDRDVEMSRLRGVDLQDYTLSDFHVEWNGSEALVSYTVTMHGTLNGQPLPGGPLRILAVWHRSNREWIRVAHAWLPAQ